MNLHLSSTSMPTFELSAFNLFSYRGFPVYHAEVRYPGYSTPLQSKRVRLNLELGYLVKERGLTRRTK